MRHPEIESESLAWEANILTTIPMALGEIKRY